MDENLDFLNIDVDAAVELAVMPEDEEHEVAILDVNAVADKYYVQVKLAFIHKEFTRSISHFITYPKPEDDTEKENGKKLRIRAFFKTFNITQDEAKDPETWKGKLGWIITGVEKDADSIEKYGRQNRVKSFLARRD